MSPIPLVVLRALLILLQIESPELPLDVDYYQAGVLAAEIEVHDVPGVNRRVYRVAIAPVGERPSTIRIEQSELRSHVFVVHAADQDPILLDLASELRQRAVVAPPARHASSYAVVFESDDASGTLTVYRRRYAIVATVADSDALLIFGAASQER